MAGASESGGFGGGNGCSNGAPCEGGIDVVEGTRGAFGALEEDASGGGTKNDGFIRVARPEGALSDVSSGRDVAKEVSGRAVVVGEIMDGIGIGVRVGGADITVRDCAEWAIGGRDAVVEMVSGVLMRAVFWKKRSSGSSWFISGSVAEAIGPRSSGPSKWDAVGTASSSKNSELVGINLGFGGGLEKAFKILWKRFATSSHSRWL
jgi:hypothetical protein